MKAVVWRGDRTLEIEMVEDARYVWPPQLHALLRDDEPGHHAPFLLSFSQKAAAPARVA